ncbi:MAG: hypothetical protein QOE09_2830 [Ilumatobacteraceae bacterium]|jgi:hypothetical protein
MKVLVAIAVSTTALFGAPLVVSVLPATASCVAPTVKFKPTRIARGGVLTITGQYFGDNCLDTGTLPAGVGPLGNPLAGLVIVIDQGDREFEVATGSAGSDYTFKVDVVVPAGLDPGDASINILGVGDARLTTSPPLVISTASPVGSTDTTVATFGSPTTAVTEPPGSAPPVVLPAEIPDPQAATPPPLSAVPIQNSSDTRDLQRAIAIGVAGVVAIGAIGFAVWARSRGRRD